MTNKKTEEIADAKTNAQTPASSLLDFLSIITKYRKFISRFILLCTVLTAIIVLLLPKWYKSTASVFPAEKADLLGGLEGIASLAKSFSPSKALSSISGNSEADRYLAILKSGTVLNAVIQKFDLVHVYDITDYPIENTIKELLTNVDFKIEDEGNITITVYDKDPQRAADMTNYFVEMLNKTNTGLQGQNARGNRQFIEERYKKNLSDLAKAEDSLKSFQKKYGVIALPEQMEASIKAAAEITGQLALKEVQANVLRRTQSADNPSVIATQIEIDELHNKLTQMNRGTNIPQNEMKVFVPFNKIPDLGGEYIRWFRDVEIQYKILQFLTPLYEQAKVEEQRQTPSVIILDSAIPAERKAKPKVSLYALIALVVSALLSMLIIFSIEGFERLRASDPVRFNTILHYLRSDWFGLKWKNIIKK
ncbi:MAG: Wzz/FepE/Etk N-terminal domain-containing protein [Ignavibacteriales bacterium]|nr:Wzz/FepE/Etk N-terminal domain-containing protein [Ignavibacteriales bacterium]